MVHNAKTDIPVFSSKVANFLSESGCKLVNVRKNHRNDGNEPLVFYFERTKLAESLIDFCSSKKG